MNEVDTLNPIFNITAETQVAVMWFEALDGMDFMGLVYRDSLTANWRATYRFRYYDTEGDGDPFNHKDRKSVFEVAPTDNAADDSTRDKLVAAFDNITTAMHSGGKAKTSDRVEINGTGTDFLKAITTRSWSNVKVAAKSSETVQ